MDTMGSISDVVETSTITRWQFTKLLDEPKPRGEDEDTSPFPWRNDLNAKIALWSGNITRLNVHAITHSTNEHMDDRNPLSDEIYRQAGDGLLNEVRDELKVCKTGEAKLTKGHNLPARFVIHAVGPRYNVKYITAAESALFSCYRSTLQICKEANLRTLGLGAIHTLRRNYPPERGAHIAIRTVRRFLENYPDAVDLVVFACNEENLEAYRDILPLYFPRSAEEEEQAFDRLPSDVGNEQGEPVVKDRQIRIIDKPIFAAYKAADGEFEQTIDLNKEFQQSMAADVGHHPFANMEDDPDKHKYKHLHNNAEIRRIEAKRRYEQLLKKANSEDLTDIASLHCLYRSGEDQLGRPVVVFLGKNFPAHSAHPEKTLLYLIRVMDQIVESDYVVVYFHSLTTGANQPTLAYLRNCYSYLDERYKKNLKQFYIVHPTWWSKLATWFFTTFTASGIKHKVHNLRGVQFLYTKINPDQIDIPGFVHEHDIKVNGPRYEVPDTEVRGGL